ncbi:MAG: hypothetical protein ACO1Q7_09465 [Gemmatimonas sp.]
MSRRFRANQWYRSLTALFGVWFVLANAGIASTHGCVTHDGAAATAVAAAAAATGDAHDHHHDGVAQTAHRNTADAGSSHDGTSHQGAHTCSCIGSCCIANVPVPTAAAVVAFLETLSEPTAQHSEPTALRHDAQVDLVLPFATAPPMNRHA